MPVTFDYQSDFERIFYRLPLPMVQTVESFQVENRTPAQVASYFTFWGLRKTDKIVCPAKGVAPRTLKVTLSDGTSYTFGIPFRFSDSQADILKNELAIPEVTSWEFTGEVIKWHILKQWLD
jgi:hypothetical protein